MENTWIQLLLSMSHRLLVMGKIMKQKFEKFSQNERTFNLISGSASAPVFKGFESTLSTHVWRGHVCNVRWSKARPVSSARVEYCRFETNISWQNLSFQDGGERICIFLYYDDEVCHPLENCQKSQRATCTSGYPPGVLHDLLKGIVGIAIVFRSLHQEEMYFSHWTHWFHFSFPGQVERLCQP